MNPVSRRGQLFLALAAEANKIDTSKKRNTYVRLRRAERLLNMFEKRLDDVDLEGEKRRVLEEKRDDLARKIREKKKTCTITGPLP